MLTEKNVFQIGAVFTEQHHLVQRDPHRPEDPHPLHPADVRLIKILPFPQDLRPLVKPQIPHRNPRPFRKLANLHTFSPFNRLLSSPA